LLAGTNFPKPKTKFIQRAEFGKIFMQALSLRERKKILQLHGIYRNIEEKISAQLLHLKKV
jgi:hypothetical protein